MPTSTTPDDRVWTSAMQIERLDPLQTTDKTVSMTTRIVPTENNRDRTILN
jgi:hypothetical protein